MKQKPTHPKSLTTGVLAIKPGAAVDAVDQPGASGGEIAVLPIRGALTHHLECGYASYDWILAEAHRLMSSPDVDTLVLDIDSPGGAVSGCFACADELTAMAEATGTRLIAYAHNATSAAYALATACERIYAAPSSIVGSIGVIQQMTDATEQLASIGVKTRLVTSGARKADGNPMQALTDDAIAAAQAQVDELAAMFYDRVATARGLTAVDVKNLEAATFTGAQGVKLGLVDELLTFGQCLSRLAATTEDENEMNAKKMTAALKALSAEQRASVMAALAAEDEKDESEASDDGDEKDDADAEDEKDDADAEDDKDDADAEDDKDDADASASAGAKGLAAELAATRAQLNAVVKTMKADKENAERDRLLASRPDLDPTAVKILRDAPLKVVRRFVKDTPKGTAPTAGAVNALGVQPSAAGGASKQHLTDLERHVIDGMDRAMGMHSTDLGAIEVDGNRLTFGRLVSTKETKTNG